MAKKYDKIYLDLKNKIENEEYPYQTHIPPESVLVKEYECSRNTVRRAIRELAREGYVISINGKGVIVIYKQNLQSRFALGGVEAFHQASVRNKKKYHTQVLCFTRLIVDERISKRTTFPKGKEIFYIQRLRKIDDTAYILDHNYFLSDLLQGLTPEIASKSIYEYMQKELNQTIAATRRILTIEKAAEIDGKYMDLEGYHCVAVVSSYSFNADGIMFEFTQSRHKPEGFVFFDQSQTNPVSYFM